LPGDVFLLVRAALRERIWQAVRQNLLHRNLPLLLEKTSMAAQARKTHK
jgi:hypothetical protein